MPWQADANSHAGFSEAKPWLPLPDVHAERSVDAQDGDPDSVLSFTREAIALRNSSPALRHGTIRFEGDGDLLVFDRTHEGETRRCVFNLTAEPLPYTGPADAALHIGDAASDGTVPAWSGFIGPA